MPLKIWSRVICLAAAAGLVACSGEKETADAPPPPAPPVAEEDISIIPATDELGNFETRVSGLALWEHPDRPFESAVLAANGTAGLIMISFDAQIVTTVPGNFDNGLALSYLQTVNGNRAVIAARDTASDSLRLLRTATEPVEISDWDLSGDTSRLVGARSALCLVHDYVANTLVLFARSGNRVERTLIMPTEADGLDISAAPDLALRNIVACSGDDMSGTVYLLDDAGRVHVQKALPPDAEPDGESQAEPPATELVALPDGDVTRIAVMLQEGESYLLAMVSSGPYVIYAYQLDAGTPVGAFTLGEFSDIAAVETISAFAGDASNFGSLYRDGVIAIVEGAETYALKLAPWGAVRNLMDLPAAARIDRRAIGAPEDEPPTEDIILDLPAFSEPPVDPAAGEG